MQATRKGARPLSSWSPALAALAALALAPATRADTPYTSSTAFESAAGPLTTEDYGTFAAGTDVPAGTTLDDITYVEYTGTVTYGTPIEGVITTLYNSFSGNSLGGLETGGNQYFYGGDTVTITFPNPVTAAGIFFNVNANSGEYFIDTPAGDATTGSASFDTSTFVFAGLTSTTPFTSATFGSTDTSLGSFNVPELLYSPAATPEPSAIAPFAFVGLGLLGLTWRARRRMSRAA